MFNNEGIKYSGSRKEGSRQVLTPQNYCIRGRQGSSHHFLPKSVISHTVMLVLN